MQTALISSIRSRFSEISLGELANEVDLTSLGVLNTLAETCGKECDTEPILSAAMHAITAISTRIILQDSADPELERSLLIETVVSLSSLEADRLESVRELIQRIESHARMYIPDLVPFLAGASSTSDESPAEAAEEAFPAEAMGITARDLAAKVIDPDRIVLTSSEDAVVYNEFVSESREHLDSIEDGILKLEHDAQNIEIINRLFRCFHSIKGAAGFLGLCTTNALCHDLENLLDRARKQTLVIDRVTADIILSATDIQKKLLDNIKVIIDDASNGSHECPPMDILPIKTSIQALLTREPAAAIKTVTDEQPDVSRLGGKLIEAGVIDQATLAKALMEQKRPLGKILVDMGAATPEMVEEVSKTVAGGRKQADFIKVDTKKLDEMLAQVGELVTSQTIVGTDPLLRQLGNEKFARNVNNLMKITRSLQDMVMGLRMLPLRQTFQRMFRLVRDTAAKTGKEVNLVLSGEDTEIDKTLIDEIHDPLVHLMRNAVDHGVETPDVRVQRGKPATGQIQLSAYHYGGNVVIELRDDGAGLDSARLLAKARQLGMASPDREYTEQEIFEFILAPGFSTKDAATEISGRGVGMDVVRRNIDAVGGRLEIRSALGKGTTFTVRLPITMAIVDGMIVEAAGQKFVIPTLSIEESIQAQPDMFCDVSGRGRVIMLRDEVIKIASLSALLGMRSANPDSSLVLIVTSEDRKVGIMVDRIIGQQQVVIKSMGESLKGIHGLAGGCILGDGRVALILDIAGLLEQPRN